MTKLCTGEQGSHRRSYTQIGSVMGMWTLTHLQCTPTTIWLTAIATITLHFSPAFSYKLSCSGSKELAQGWRQTWMCPVWLFNLRETGVGGVSVVWETMLGRHVKPGNGRKRKRAVWPPLPHLLGDTVNQETGRGVGHGGSVGMEEKVEIER